MTCSFLCAFSADVEDGATVMRQAQYMSVEFCVLLDWYFYKAPFGTRPEFERSVDRQIIAQFLEHSRLAHSAPGARAAMAAGL